MNIPKRYLITSALPYANGPLHVGHIAGAYISADIYARYLRLKGADVKFICGSDEHGAAITIQAKREGTTPQAIVDKYHELNKKSFEQFGISFDIYHRTSAKVHHKTSADFFKKLYDDGVFEEKVSEQYYDEEHDQFLADRYISGRCPKCESEGAYGDQCEKCGSSLSPTDLIDPKSTLSGNTPILKTTKHWYLPLGKYEQWVKEWIENAQESETWKKHVLGQCRSWIESGLESRAMTRDLDWGIKVPLPDADGKVLYVWMDAPIGYISATKALTDEWATYWQNEDTKLVHFIGKDNIVFHCIIFPILLHAHGDFVLPANVPANQFMNLEGDKISTSRNWAVWLHEYLADFPGKEDVLRYTLISNMPEQKDSEFTWADFQTKNNSELVGIVGNLVNRVVVLLHKYFDGVLPQVSEEAEQAALEKAHELFETLEQLPKKLDEYIHAYEFRNALSEVVNVARVGNKFLADTTPWHLIKTDKDQTAAVLGISLELVAHLSVYLEPFLPATAYKIRQLLNFTDQDVADILDGCLSINYGHKVNKAELLFEKLDDKVIQAQIDKLEASKQAKAEAAKKEAESAAPVYAPIKPTISFDDFTKLDIRTGTVTAAEKIRKANKLLKLTVDIGLETRTVVSGIAKHYTPEEVIGQKVLLLANLAPRKLKGVESQGMILMTEEGDNLVFLSPDKEVGDGNVVS